MRIHPSRIEYISMQRVLSFFLALSVLLSPLAVIAAFPPERAIWSQRGYDPLKTGAIPWESGPNFVMSGEAIKAKETIQGVSTYGDLVICSGTNGSVFTLAKWGAAVWATRLDSKPIGVPAFSRGHLFVLKQNGKLAKLKENNGSIVWDIKMVEEGQTDITVVGDRLGVFAGKKSVVCVDLETGIRVWEKAISGNVQPLSCQGTFVLVNSENELSCFLLGNGNKVWSRKLETGFAGVPVIFGDKVYVGTLDEKIMCLSLWAGETVWQAERGYSGAAPTVADGKVWVPGNGIIWCYGADDGKLVWKSVLDKKSDFIFWNQLAKSGNLLIASGNSPDLYILDATNGQTKKKLKVSSGVGVDLAFGFDYMVAIDAKKQIFIFGFSK